MLGGTLRILVLQAARALTASTVDGCDGFGVFRRQTGSFLFAL